MAQAISKMETTQTAVEWLDRWFRDNPEATHEEGNKALQQAKAMEKEQMHKCASFWRGKENEIEKPMFDLYYNETYGNTNSN